MLSVLSGDVSVAEAARKEKACEQSIVRWKAEFFRIDEGTSTARFCELFNVPERSWRCWQARS